MSHFVAYIVHVVLGNHSGQNSPWGEGGQGLQPSQGLFWGKYQKISLSAHLTGGMNIYGLRILTQTLIHVHLLRVSKRK